ncbi:MAG TPA: serine/threonine-protein kinase, partial [Planctomycetota bacterium]|nr:serine/threonine-protein kinase [Planctomycetota bacterium]
PVAIKIMTDRYQADPQGEKRFMREARAQAIVNHPNMATVLNFGVSQEGRPFLVMEYLEGQDLRTILRAEKVIEPLRACDLLRQACDGLDEAHSAGLVHRDLKPSNLMIVKDHRGQPWVKVLDLGLAKIVRGQTDLKSITMDTAGMLVGTPAYMSPEQVAGAMVDGRADIYSLGVVFFEMLTGRLPFESETMEGWLYQHLHVKPPVPSTINQSLKSFPQLDQIVLRMMAKPANERYRSAGELSGLLKKVAAQAANPPAKKSGTRAAFENSPPPAGTAKKSGPRPAFIPEVYDAAPPPPDGNAPPPPGAVPPAQAAVLKHNRELELRRQQYEQHCKSAKEAEADGHWDQALAFWRKALPLAENAEPIKQRLEVCRLETDFLNNISESDRAAAAGEWERAEEVLNKLGALRPSDIRIEQARARLPKKLTEAWLGMARTRCESLPEGDLRSMILERLGIAYAQAGDMQQALTTLQDATKKTETRVIGLAQAIVAAIQYGNHEGLRPYLDRAIGAANGLTDPSDRGRAMLELGRAFTAYGDQGAAAAAFQNALSAFSEANAKGIPMQVSSARKSNASMRRISGEMTRVSMTTTNVNAAKSIKASWEAAVGVVATAQAEAGLVEDSLATTAIIEDPWTLASATSQVVQALAKTGRSVEAERLANQIGFAMAKMQALRAIAVSRVYRGDLEGAAETLKQINNPADKVPLYGLLATAWALRNEKGRAEVRIAEAEKCVDEIVGARARFRALIGACEPILNAGFQDAGKRLVEHASRLIDLVDDPAERLRCFLQLAQLEENALSAKDAAATRTMVFSQGPSPLLLDLLRRALVVWRQVRNGPDRFDCVERLGYQIGCASTPVLASELLASCKDEAERALIYIGLSSGLA